MKRLIKSFAVSLLVGLVGLLLAVVGFGLFMAISMGDICWADVERLFEYDNPMRGFLQTVPEFLRYGLGFVTALVSLVTGFLGLVLMVCCFFLFSKQFF